MRELAYHERLYSQHSDKKLHITKTNHKSATGNYFLFRFNPILTGLFESKFLLGGGGVNLTPLSPSDLGPEGADRRDYAN